MLKFNNKVLNINGNWLNPHVSPVPPGPEPYPFDEVTIGTQTWMAKNLSIDDGGGGIYILNNVSANGVNFGTQYYYTWDAAIRVSSSIEGWHLPTVDEWDALSTVVGGYDIAGIKLKSTSGWNNDGNGTDDYGFTAFPVGKSNWMNIGSSVYLWTSNQGGLGAYFRSFSTDALMSSGSATKNSDFSVRLIKDT